MNFLDVKQFDTYAAGCTGRAGVVVQWDSEDSTPRTDGKTIYIPRLKSTDSEDVLLKYRMFIKHETSHITSSDFDYLAEVKPRGLLALVNNILEDFRIDFLNDKEYAGDVKVSEDYYAYFASVVDKNITSNETWKQLSPLFAWDAKNRGWIASASLLEAAIKKHIVPGSLEMDRYAKLMSGSYSSDIFSVLNIGSKRAAAESVFSLAKRIVEEVFEAKPEQDESPMPSEGGEGSSEGTTSSDTVAEGEGDSGALSEENIITVMEQLGAQHEPNSTRVGVHVEYDKKARKKGWTIPAPSDYIVLHKGAKPDGWAGATLNKHRVFSTIDKDSASLGNKLRIKLQTRSRDRYETGVRKGKIHNGSLHRVLSGDDKTAERIFKRRIISNTLDTAVLLLVDCSGSMGGAKYDAACAVAGTLSKALTPINIEHAVLGFTTDLTMHENPVMHVFRDFGERVTTNELVRRFDIASGFLNQNADGDSVMFAYNYLLQRKEHRKVLLVMSDGSPAGRDWAGDGYSYLKHVCQTIEKGGAVDLYGVGIMDNNVSKFYSKHTVLDNLAQLSPTILSVLDSSI